MRREHNSLDCVPGCFCMHKNIRLCDLAYMKGDKLLTFRHTTFGKKVALGIIVHLITDETIRKEW